MPSAAVWERLAAERLQRAFALAALACVLGISIVLLLFVTSFATPTDQIARPATRLKVGNLRDFEVGKPQVFWEEGKFWLVRLNEREVVALYALEPRDDGLLVRGCTVPWRETFSFTDPRTDVSSTGWFRDPCRGATYYADGRCAYGPCVRGLDRYPVTVGVDGTIIVNINQRLLIKGPERGR